MAGVTIANTDACLYTQRVYAGLMTTHSTHTPSHLAPHVVISSSTKSPGGRGTYRRVALVRTTGEGETPTRIADSDAAVAAIVDTWERMNVGRTERGAFQRSVVDALHDAEVANLLVLQPAWMDWRGEGLPYTEGRGLAACHAALLFRDGEAADLLDAGHLEIVDGAVV